MNKTFRFFFANIKKGSCAYTPSAKSICELMPNWWQTLQSRLIKKCIHLLKTGVWNYHTPTWRKCFLNHRQNCQVLNPINELPWFPFQYGMLKVCIRFLSFTDENWMKLVASSFWSFTLITGWLIFYCKLIRQLCMSMKS